MDLEVGDTMPDVISDVGDDPIRLNWKSMTTRACRRARGWRRARERSTCASGGARNQNKGGEFD